MPVENTPPALPPTPTRIQLAKDIKAGKIRRYGWVKPWTHRSYDDRDVTAWVKRFIDATPKLAEYGEANDHDYSIVALTPAGEEWLNRYGSNDLPTCAYCALEINETPARRDTRHDHCGPLPHTGAPRGPYCERCR